MDNNLLAAQEQMDNGGEAAMDAGDWRDLLQFDSRMRIVRKIMDTLTRHLHIFEQECLLEFWRISARFEEKVFTEATSQSAYLWKISTKMLAFEIKSQDPLKSNEASSTEENPSDQVMDTQDSQDWKDNLHADSRQRIVNKMTDNFAKHLPFAGPEDLHELRRIAIGLEDEIYTAATSQFDYLRKISMKMLKFEMEHPLQSNGANTGQNSSDQERHGI